MNESIKELLKQTLLKYGESENIISSAVLKHNWEKDAYYDTACPSKKDDLYIRDCLIGQGQILEEDLDNHVYINLTRVGKATFPVALLITKMDDEKVHIAAYAKEGLIRQHLAEKAVKNVKLLLNGCNQK